MIIDQNLLKALEALAKEGGARLRELASEQRRLRDENAKLRSEGARLKEEIRRAEAGLRLQVKVKARLQRLSQKLEGVVL